MNHLDEGQILALRDAPGEAPDEAHAHLTTCGTCRGSLDEARRRAAAVSGALASLDAGPRDLADARDRVRRRVAEHSAAGAAAAPLLARPRRALWGLSRAAGLILLAATGLSALPGSPVRGWLARALVPATTAPAPSGEVPAAASEATAAPAEEAGIRIPLAAGPLTVLLRGAEPGTVVRVLWIPGNEAAVFAPAGSRFTSGTGRVEATLEPGAVRVELPRSVLPVTLEVNGRMILRNSARGLDVSEEAVERSEAGVTFRLPPS
jgi:hypothetical protein